MNQIESHIKHTYLLAKQAVSEGNHPFGALLLLDDQVVLTQLNTVITSGDVTQHAEIELVRKAHLIFSKDQLSRATLYTSTEPCAMCAGSIFWSGISSLVFGCSAKALGEITGGSLVIPCVDIFSHGNRIMNIIGPILEQEGQFIHQKFWAD